MKIIILLAALLSGTLPVNAMEDCEEKRATSEQLGIVVGSIITTCNYLENGWLIEEVEQERMATLKKAFTDLKKNYEISDKAIKNILSQPDSQTLSRCGQLIQELGYDK